MLKRHFVVGLFTLIMLLSVQNIFASTISVQIEQVDKLHNDVTETTLLIEESILEYLFSKGMIVSTCPIVVDSSTSQTGFAMALNDARSGYSDFLIYISVYFNPQKSEFSEKINIQNIDLAQWRIIRINDNKQTASGKLEPKKLQSTENPVSEITNFGIQIAASLNSSLK